MLRPLVAGSWMVDGKSVEASMDCDWQISCADHVVRPREKNQIMGAFSSCHEPDFVIPQSRQTHSNGRVAVQVLP